MNNFIKAYNNTKSNKKMRQMRPVPSVLDLIYPPVCGVCGKLDQDFLCKKCERLLKKQAIFEVYNNEDEKKYFSQHLYIFQYQGIIRKMIIDYKFNSKSYIYKTFSSFLLKNKNFFENLQKYDTIVPVPISKKRFYKRGYNQSYLLAKEIASKTRNNM